MAAVPRTPTAHPPAAGLDPSAPPYDSVVLFVTGALMTLGVAAVYSASVTVAGAELDWRQWWRTPLRQSVFAVAGFLGMLFMAHANYRWLDAQRPGGLWRAGLLYGLAAALLAAVLLIGSEVLGAQRSIVVLHSPFTLSFQPAELAKVVLVLWLAALLGRWQEPQPPRGIPRIRQFWRGFLPAIASAGVLIALTGIEDFGTAALMGAVTLALLLLGGARWLHLLGFAALGAAGGTVLIALKPYRLQRILTFLSEAPDPQGEGYQVDQSLLALGSGGWLGRGLGGGVRKYGYLPQQNNDFILATIGEELGTVGALVIVLLFVLLLLRGWRLARRAGDPLAYLLAAGITLMVALHAAFNIAVVTNSVPTKGISLPFVSAGGSGVLFLGAAAGLLASLERAGGRRELRTVPMSRR